MLFGYGICVSLGNIREHFINDADMAFISCIPAGPHRIFRFLQACCSIPESGFCRHLPHDGVWVVVTEYVCVSQFYFRTCNAFHKQIVLGIADLRQAEHKVFKRCCGQHSIEHCPASFWLGIRLRDHIIHEVFFPFLMVSAVAARLFRKPLRTNFSRHTLDGQNSLAAETKEVSNILELVRITIGLPDEKTYWLSEYVSQIYEVIPLRKLISFSKSADLSRNRFAAVLPFHCIAVIG